MATSICFQLNISFYSEDSLRWKTEFTEKYPNPEFLTKSNDDINEELDEISIKRQLILEQLNINPKST